MQDHRVVVLDLDPSTAVFLAACDATPSLQAALTQTMTAQADFDLALRSQMNMSLEEHVEYSFHGTPPTPNS